MKLGTVLATMSAAVLMTAQPAMAEASRSAQSLPSVSAPSQVAGIRRASKIEDADGLVGVPVLVLIAGIGLVIVVLDALGVINILGLSNNSDS